MCSRRRAGDGNGTALRKGTFEDPEGHGKHLRALVDRCHWTERAGHTQFKSKEATFAWLAEAPGRPRRPWDSPRAAPHLLARVSHTAAFYSCFKHGCYSPPARTSIEGKYFNKAAAACGKNGDVPTRGLSDEAWGRPSRDGREHVAGHSETRSVSREAMPMTCSMQKQTDAFGEQSNF